MTTRAVHQIERIAQQLERAGTKAERRGQPEDWHRLRTTSRRLRGALDALAGAGARKVRRQAKRITKLPAKVRDLDVALRNLRQLSARASRRAERLAAVDLIERLSRRRARRDRQLRRHLRRTRPVQALLRRLQKVVDRVHLDVAPAAGGVLGQCAREVLARRTALQGWEDDGQRLHDLRVAVKHYRGALAAWAEAMAEAKSHGPTLEALHTLLDVLGEHHDWTELAGRIEARRRTLADRGARRRELRGYEALLARARKEQRTRLDSYLVHFHRQLPGLLSAGASEAPAPRRARAAANAGAN